MTTKWSFHQNHPNSNNHQRFESFYFDLICFHDSHNLLIFLLFQSTTSQPSKTNASKGLDDSDEDMPINSFFKPTSSAKTKQKVFQETLRKFYFMQSQSREFLETYLSSGILKDRSWLSTLQDDKIMNLSSSQDPSQVCDGGVNF